MATGDYQSEDDLLRDALKALEDYRQMLVNDKPEVLAGIQRGLHEMRQGLGRPFADFDAELRVKHAIRDDLQQTEVHILFVRGAGQNWIKN